MACCKVHKETCSSLLTSETKLTTAVDDNTVITEDSSVSSSNYLTLQSKLNSSVRLQTFLSTNPYLKTQLPVLITRIDRQETLSPSASSELAKDLEKKERIGAVLKEAVELDPIVAELFNILQEENLI